MKQKDIYWAELDPVKGSEQRGKRPVVIISGDAMNNNLDIVICCPLSTSVKNYSGCIILERDGINNLKSDSEIITFQVRAISKARLTKKIGEISTSQLKYVITGLNEILVY
ncbi:MAG: type II toxin-antitoxin system PemK/MazF family toxin [Ignavibacteria bacterium]